MPTIGITMATIGCTLGAAQKVMPVQIPAWMSTSRVTGTSIQRGQVREQLGAVRGRDRTGDLAGDGFKPGADVRWPPFIEEIDVPEKFAIIRRRLLQKGFSAADCAKILGGNFLRIYQEILG